MLMLRKFFKYIILFLLTVVFPAASSVALPPDMAPPPGERLDYENTRLPGQLKRDKYGFIDPSPDVVSLEYLPKDAYGFVDWAQAMRDGIIAPKDSLPDSKPLGPEDSTPFDEEVLIKSKLDFMPDVIFPHKAHNRWLKCSVCHPKIFARKAGGNPGLSMANIWKGKFCGRCHDRIAFPTRNCFKCHSAPRKASTK
jgi:c(7)-type cytochrome triheme protein